MKRARTGANEAANAVALPDWAKNMTPEQLGRVVMTKEAGQFLGLSRVSIYRHTKLGNLPEPIRFGPRSKGWRLVDLIIAQDRMAHGGGAGGAK